MDEKGEATAILYGFFEHYDKEGNLLAIGTLMPSSPEEEPDVGNR